MDGFLIGGDEPDVFGETHSTPATQRVKTQSLPATIGSLGTRMAPDDAQRDEVVAGVTSCCTSSHSTGALQVGKDSGGLGI